MRCDLEPTLDDAAARDFLAQVHTMCLGRGYNSDATRRRLAECDVDDAVIAKMRQRGSAGPATTQPIGLRWQVERTNWWLSNFGGLRRNNDRKTVHRLAQLSLAVVFIITAKLIDYRNRWMPDVPPIRGSS